MSVSIMLAVTVEAVEGKNNQSSLFTTKDFSYPLSLSILVKTSFSYQRVLKHELNYTVSVRREETLWDLPVTLFLHCCPTNSFFYSHGD